MSDTEHETQAAPDTDPEAPQTDEPTPEQDEPSGDPNQTGPLEIPTPLRETDEEGLTGPTATPDEDEGEQDGEPEQEQEQAAPEGLSEKELEAIRKQLRNENARHRNRLIEITGESFGGHIPCPACTNGVMEARNESGVPRDNAEAEGHVYIDGWIVPPDTRSLNEDQRGRMLAILGLDSFESIPEAPWAQQCATCNGFGKVKTGSHVPEREVTTCLDCNGAGWQNRKQAASTNGELPAEIPATTGPTVYGSAEPDSRVLTLREEGWTVFPPVQIAGVS